MDMFDKIRCLPSLNDVDSEKVNALVQSLLTNGWVGAPILYCNLGLVTGSHRFAALHQLDKMLDDAEGEEFIKICNILESVAVADVTEIINNYCEENECSFSDIDFSNIGIIFKGTEIEQYKNEIVEW